MGEQSFFIGETVYQPRENGVQGEYVRLLGEPFYRIQNVDAMPPFFMSIVSSSNHWLFISSTGGISAGRINAESALFPYYTVDKITESSENTGSKAFFLVKHGTRTQLWEPFSDRYPNTYRIQRNLYKNVSGTALVFEEINHDLQLRYRYAWRTSDIFGFVKTTWLENLSDTPCNVEVVDGLQNLLPANVTSLTQMSMSVLLDAYKRSELEPKTGLGIFSLSSRLTDLAEPSESLKATIVWQLGLDNAQYLLSSSQLDQLRAGKGAQQETDIRGQRCAYFVHAHLDLAPQSETSWHLVADVNQDHNTISRLINSLNNNRDDLSQNIEHDIALNSVKLESIIASADGLQTSNDPMGTAHHFANVLFNVMRGGIFADQYRIDTVDLREFVAVRNRKLLDQQSGFFSALPLTLTLSELRQRADSSGSADLVRLCYSYLPLTFSRRHGDPSRPWNRFEINVKRADGSQKLDYEGNWRDIFQNWEALAYSYPEYIEGMLSTFLNATTPDGYNPYRVTRSGIDWEIPEPGNPWANIGYWSDHQIIYLQKLMEVCAKFYPGKLQDLLSQPVFSYANVPYRIKPYSDILTDPYNTIQFDWDEHRKIATRVKELGSDGKLVLNSSGDVLHVTLAEKLLTLMLAKLVNFVPEGGIWMTTQRPEWNDANNALVGKGLSVVTLGYLRRYVEFFAHLLENTALTSVPVANEVVSLFKAINDVLFAQRSILDNLISDVQRKSFIDVLGQVGSDFRWNYYKNGISGEVTPLLITDIRQFLTLSQHYIEHSLRANKRPDSLYHAYNTLKVDGNRATISYLSEMFEGQVAILSSGLLTPEQSLDLIQAIRQSALYRADQHSYILYPNRRLPGFLEKNYIDADQVSRLALVNKLLEHGDQTLITRDANGDYHFSGNIRNAKDVAHALAHLKAQPQYAPLVDKDSKAVQDIFESVFHHDAFTGRSGTFFAYEGLGSIYWHMVSKYLLAAQEAVENAVKSNASPDTIQKLVAAYFDIRAGLGFNKSSDVYGAFPTDPYSHTPEGQGAKQPGMTGMVKEEIMTRLAELGLVVERGQIRFNPVLMLSKELLARPSTLRFIDVDGQSQALELSAGTLGYTFCQVPIIVQLADEPQITVKLAEGSSQVISGSSLDDVLSQHIFARDGYVRQLTVSFARS